MTSLLSRLDELSSPLVEQITKYAGVSHQHAKLGVGVVGAGLGVAALWKLFGGPRYNLPPGPRPLPLIGNLHNIGSNPKGYEVFSDLKKIYGDVVTIYLGPYRVLVLNSAAAIRQAFLKDDLTYADRQEMASLNVLTENGKDIVAGQYGPRLQQQRKLALAALRKYASGEALEHHVQFSFDAMCQELDKKGKFVPFDMAHMVAYNILASMCFGTKFEFDDPFMIKMMNIQKEFDSLLNDPTALFYLLPMMQHFPSQIMKALRNFTDVFRTYLDESFNSHLETYDPKKLTDFSYHLIHVWKEAQADETEGTKTKLLEKDHFKYILLDMFVAGTDTTRNTLAWIWQYLAAFPEVQAKAQKEIDDNWGDGKVTVHCREKLPYVDAVLHEVMRIRPAVANGIPRCTRNDTKLFGYDIPKGTMVVNNTWAAHHDERVWKDHDAFLPGRWLDENGQYVFQQNGFLPFSVGRRACIGESFAKLELHMLATMLLQKYTLKPAPGKRISVEAMDGMLVKAKDQDIYVERRK